MKLRTVMAAMLVAVVMMAGSANAGEKININSASAEQLQVVKGIGEKTAAAIVAYREAHGAFKAVSDLVNVKGIGEKKLDKIDDNLVVE
jgi:competence protein ComEA